MHLNVPSLEQSEVGWHWALNGWLPYWPSRLYLRLFQWMTIIAIAAELGVAMAASQFYEARSSERYFDFSMAHAFYMEMGGFVLAVPRAQSQSGQWVASQPLNTKNLDCYF
jgi:hypothetical protein